MVESRAPARAIVIAAFVLLCLVWGSTWLVIKQGLQDLPVFSSAAIRFTVAAAVFAGLAPRLHRAEGGERPSVPLWLAMGVFNFGLSYGIVYWGEQVLPSGLASVLWAVFPILTAVSGHFFLPGERLAGRQWLGFLVGLGGVGVLFATDLRSFGPESVFVGAVFLLSPLSATIGQTIVKRGAEKVSATLLNRNGMAVGAVMLWVPALALEDPFGIVWTTRGVLSVAYLSVVGTVLTFGLYYWLLRFAPSNRMSLIAYVSPAIALWLGAGVGDEPVGLTTLGGSGLILAGIWLAMRR